MAPISWFSVGGNGEAPKHHGVEARYMGDSTWRAHWAIKSDERVIIGESPGHDVAISVDTIRSEKKPGNEKERLSVY